MITSNNSRQGSMNNFFVFIARTIVCFEKGYYPKTKIRIWISGGIIFLIFYGLVEVDNDVINRFLFIPVGSALAFTIFLVWIRSKYYKSFVIINKKYFTPNTIKESPGPYDLVSLGLFTYKTVNIGNQTWMAENLRFIPYVNREFEDGGIWVTGYSGNDVKMAVLTKNYFTYGCLYSIETASYACPEGYHLPTIDEWMTLINCFGGINMAGNRIKAQAEWNRETPQVTNESGFSALPGGYCNYSGQCLAVGTVGYWWSSSLNGSKEAIFICMQDNRSVVIKQRTYGLNSGFSIRCIKDKENFSEQ